MNRLGKIFEIVSGNKTKRNQSLLLFGLNTWADGTIVGSVGGKTGMRETRSSYLSTT